LKNKKIAYQHRVQGSRFSGFPAGLRGFLLDRSRDFKDCSKIDGFIFNDF
jgi:hypothetical protein